MSIPDPAGWFPDPNGRHEHRYFNGRAWTADVADAGNRAIDPYGSGPSPVFAPYPPAAAPAGGNGQATAALVCGLVGALIAWMPFVVVAGFVLAVLAIVFGVQGLRRANRADVATGRGKAIAGLVLGAVAIGLSVLGTILSVVVFREVRAFMDPAPHVAEVESCRIADGAATVSGTLTNLGTERAAFSLYPTVRAGDQVFENSNGREIDVVEPGATVDWQTTTFVRTATGPCTATVDVFGPLPFGVEVERP